MWRGPFVNASRTPLTAGSRGLAGKRESPTILVIGCLGQIGQELVPELKRRFPISKVLMSDVRKPFGNLRDEHVRYIDLTTTAMLTDVVIGEKVDWIIHNASVLSAVGEKNPDLAMRVNIEFVNTVLNVARQQTSHDRPIRLFIPSSISAFGPSTPSVNTPNECIQKPTTIYGVSKVYAELMGSYYQSKFGVDFRSLRYPGIISAGEPGGGTTDWAVDIFKQALLKGRYDNCFLSADTSLPMMYMPDCLNSTIDFLECDPNPKWTSRVYNVAAMSLSPRMLERELRKHIPSFEIRYAEGDFRQKIADSWPRSLDDSAARQDWGWKPQFGLEDMTRAMLVEMRSVLRAGGVDTIDVKV